MARVRVNRISSVTDPSTGLPAKQIELVEVREGRRADTFGTNDETRVIQGMLSQLQSMGLIPVMRDTGFAKVVMILSEAEYDMFGLRLDVNDVYNLEIKDGTIGLKRITDGT
ncbi:MAG TPA: arcadin 1 [Nitrososphaerales archaeon]|nr:arcadin 1 [Nitrososphaerales archaeon]